VVNDNTVTANFVTAAAAAGNVRNVTLTAPGGVSNTVAFDVAIPAAPTLTLISPPTGLRGTAVPITLTGTGFRLGATTVAVSGGGITVSGVSVLDPTTLNATFTITAAAALTARNVTVTVTGAAAASNAIPFTVVGAAITSIAPNSATHPTTGTTVVSVTFTGTNLTNATGVAGLGGGVTLQAGSFHVVSNTSVTANLVVSSAATLGAHNLGLTDAANGNTNLLPFTVN